MDVSRRLQGGLTVAALLLVVLTGWRSASIAGAPPSGDVGTVALPLERVAGGVLVRWEEQRVLLEPRRGAVASLEPNQAVEIGDARFLLRVSEPVGLTILRRPWSVYAHATRGFRRIDFGSDPLGHADGVKDRVVLPGDGGAFHLVPDRPSSEPRFLPDDRGAVLVAERGGLVVEQRGSRVVLSGGQRIAVKDRFEVEVGGSRLGVQWVEGPQTDAVVGDDGGIVGYQSSLGAELVVRRLVDSATPELVLFIEDQEGRRIRRVTRNSGSQLVHGRRDRLGPMGRGVLPSRAADLQLEAAMAEGLDEGWVSIGREVSTVDLPADVSGRSPRGDLGWTLSRSLVALLEDYDRARLPAALRAVSGLFPARGRCRSESGGAWTSLRWDESLTAWVPGDRGGAARVTLCEIPIVGDRAVIEVGLPAAWRAAGREWTPLPGTTHRWKTHEIEASGTLTVRLDARRPEAGPDRIAVSVAGGPRGTFLQPVHVSPKAFGGWDEAGPASAAAAEVVWTSVDGDRWRAEGSAPGVLSERERQVFLRVPVEAARDGLIALDVLVPGVVRGASWNGVPVPTSAFGRARAGSSRLSLRLSRGDNLLAVHTARSATAPALAAGGAAFKSDEWGRPSGLAGQVADRRARRAVADEHRPGPVTGQDGADAPAIVVERGDDTLQAGQRLRVSAGRGVAGQVTIPTDAGAVFVTSDRTHGVRVIAQGGTLWTPQGEPSDLPLHPPGSAPLWTVWSPGSRLVVRGSPARLLFPRDEGSFRTAIPAGLPAAVSLSLDDDLQDDALAVLDAHLDALTPESLPDSHALRGAVLAMDAVTGEILACVGRDRDGADAPSACWEDHDLRPGSSFKPLMALAALDSPDPTIRAMVDGTLPSGLRRAALSGALTDAKLPVLPRGASPDMALRTRLRNFRGLATPKDRALEGALRSSDNVWFGYLGLLMHVPLREGWLQSGIVDDARREAAWPPRAIARVAGFGADLDLGFGLRGHAGRVPAAAPDSDAALAARSVGQDEVRASPLGIAAVLAAIATNGEAPRPRLDPGVATTRVRLATPLAAGRVRAALHEVVRVGTASRAFAENPYRERILGKTGSSQRVDAQGIPRTDSWFAGVVLPPEGVAEHPVVLVAVLPGAGLGGAHAARVVDGLSRALAAARGWSSGIEAPQG